MALNGIIGWICMISGLLNGKIFPESSGNGLVERHEMIAYGRDVETAR